MPRRLGLIALLLFVLVGGPEPAQLRPIISERIEIRSTPIRLTNNDPARTRVGALSLVAGWRLSSASRQFGGWSALHVDGDRVTAVGDAGSVLRFRLGKFGHAYQASIVPMPRGCGRIDDKRFRDTESLALDPDGDWTVGYEWRNAFCRVSHDFALAKAVYAPPSIRDWPRSRGPESLATLNDGRTVVLAEGDRRGRNTRSLQIFDRDPSDAAARVRRYRYRPPQGYSPADIVPLPDGRWLILNRRFALTELFTTKLVLADATTTPASSVLEGPVIAQLAPPLVSDNFEGLAVTVEGGGPIVWMISDDNFFGWQATYLLKFSLDLPSLKPRQRPGRAPSRSSASTAEP